MTKNRKYLNVYLLSLGFVLIFAASCTDNERPAPDVSHIDVETKVIRTENNIAKVDTSQANILQELRLQDSSFYDLYFSRVLGVPVHAMTIADQNKFIKGFIADERIGRITQEVDSLFGDFSDMEKEFQQAFKYMKYYFPEKNIPNIYTFISEYSLQRFIFEDDQGDAISIGLDMFLGENYPYNEYVVNNTSFSAYLTRTYNKEHLVKNSIEVMVEDWLGVVPRGETLLDKMIYHGKKLYIVEQLVPQVSNEVIMGYTPEQMTWCEDNEQEMWAYFFKEELFYSTDINKISKLVNPSPQSSGMPPEAPGRTANYMGWQIIKAFMKRNDYSLDKLLTLNDYSSQKILEESRFKPKRR